MPAMGAVRRTACAVWLCGSSKPRCCFAPAAGRGQERRIVGGADGFGSAAPGGCRRHEQCDIFIVAPQEARFLGAADLVGQLSEVGHAANVDGCQFAGHNCVPFLTIVSRCGKDELLLESPAWSVVALRPWSSVSGGLPAALAQGAEDVGG